MSSILGLLVLEISWPNFVFLDFNELHVNIKSPKPDKPKIVSFFAPIDSPNLVISTKDLVINALFAFSPKFNPRVIPAAIA